MPWGQPSTPSAEARLTALEAASHPPVPMDECSVCGSLVPPTAWKRHVRWHRRLDAAAGDRSVAVPERQEVR